ncbi:MAG TPA: SWIM zinc finger family protein [Anaerolineales bacterium]|nr:SWIM zinc finger family protein [Anaerolineales bacterium]
MDNGMIRKYAKAKQYAQERDRIKFTSFSVELDGKNNPHIVQFNEGEWQCDCDYFIGRGRCSHTMALEQILESMLPEVQDAE